MKFFRYIIGVLQLLCASDKLVFVRCWNAAHNVANIIENNERPFWNELWSPWRSYLALRALNLRQIFLLATNRNVDHIYAIGTMVYQYFTKVRALIINWKCSYQDHIDFVSNCIFLSKNIYQMYYTCIRVTFIVTSHLVYTSIFCRLRQLVKHKDSISSILKGNA